MNAMICQLQDLPPYMESENKSFEPWRDYLKLADLVREMQLGRFTPEPVSAASLAVTDNTRGDTTPMARNGTLDSEIVLLFEDAPLSPSSTEGPEPLQHRPDPRCTPEEVPSPERTWDQSGRNTPEEVPSPERTWDQSGRNTPEEVPSPERKFCGFCKYNGQPESVFLSHSIKNQDGDMMCRYLQLSLCPLCGITGAQAATKHHCPPLGLGVDIYLRSRLEQAD
uniref:Nanos-type domain-containing protein n=1 Tax=Oncorhynchus tshawytscha TaxID=74940 RepID=A0AAZ3RNE0_ONCTS